MFELKNEILYSIISNSPVGMILSNAKGQLVFSNRQAFTMFGYTEQAFSQLLIEDLMPQRIRTRHHQIRDHLTKDKVQRQMSGQKYFTAIKANKQEFSIEIGLTPLTLDGEAFVLSTIIDRSEVDRIKALQDSNDQLYEYNEKLKNQASYDPLTGLANRRLFNQLIEKLLGLATRQQQKITLMFIDLDHFKAVNDNYGHECGDKVLIAVAQKLLNNSRKSDIVSRVGGDEFIVCLNDLDEEQQVVKVANKLLFELSHIDNIDGHPIHISASIGVVTVQVKPQSQISDIIAFADQLMYQAKKTGKNKAVYAQY